MANLTQLVETMQKQLDDHGILLQALLKTTRDQAQVPVPLGASAGLPNAAARAIAELPENGQPSKNPLSASGELLTEMTDPSVQKPGRINEAPGKHSTGAHHLMNWRRIGDFFRQASVNSPYYVRERELNHGVMR